MSRQSSSTHPGSGSGVKVGSRELPDTRHRWQRRFMCHSISRGGAGLAPETPPVRRHVGHRPTPALFSGRRARVGPAAWDGTANWRGNEAPRVASGGPILVHLAPGNSLKRADTHFLARQARPADDAGRRACLGCKSLDDLVNKRLTELQSAVSRAWGVRTPRSSTSRLRGSHSRLALPRVARPTFPGDPG